VFKQAGAAVEHRTLPVGHELSQADVSLARAWLEKNEALASTD
jgi:phospholipase/carboxylesterase